MSSSNRKRSRALLDEPKFIISSSRNDPNVCTCESSTTTKLKLNTAGDFVCGTCGAAQQDLHHANGLISFSPSAKPPSLLTSSRVDLFSSVATHSPLVAPHFSYKRTQPLFPEFNNLHKESSSNSVPVRNSSKSSSLLLSERNRLNGKESSSFNYDHSNGSSSRKAKSSLEQLLFEHERICDKIKSFVAARDNGSSEDDSSFELVCGFYCKMCEKLINGGLANRNLHKETEEHKSRLVKDDNTVHDAETMFEEFEKDYAGIVFVDQDADDNFQSNSATEQSVVSSGSKESSNKIPSLLDALINNEPSSIGDDNRFVENLHNDLERSQSVEDIDDEEEYVTESECGNSEEESDCAN